MFSPVSPHPGCCEEEREACQGLHNETEEHVCDQMNPSPLHGGGGAYLTGTRSVEQDKDISPHWPLSTWEAEALPGVMVLR